MVNTWAIIVNDIVENIIHWDGDTTIWQPPNDQLLVPAPEEIENYIGIGYRWDGTNFIKPPRVLSVPNVIE